VADGILNREPIDVMVAQHNSGRADHATRLWLLLNAEIWYRMQIKGADPKLLQDQLR
jgi:hypothetical protein